MQVLLARPRGFCAGVTRAIAIVERAIEVFGAPIYVRHEIVHNRTVVQKLRALASEGNIPVQTDIMRSGGTDAGAIHQSRKGVLTGGISVPCRYIHTPQEMADRRDVAACVDLALAFVRAELPAL